MEFEYILFIVSYLVLTLNKMQMCYTKNWKPAILEKIIGKFVDYNYVYILISSLIDEGLVLLIKY